MDYALWCLLGTLYGILLGVIPMAGAGTAMLLVFSFAGYFEPNPYYGLIFLISVIAASSTADSYTSLLTGIPRCFNNSGIHHRRIQDEQEWRGR
jgi:TctA family transporter